MSQPSTNENKLHANTTEIVTAVPTKKLLYFLILRVLPKAFKFFCLFLITSSFSRTSITCYPTGFYRLESHKAHRGPVRALRQALFHQAPIQTFLTSPLVRRPNHSQGVWVQGYSLLMGKLVPVCSRLPHIPPVPFCQEYHHLYQTHSSPGHPLLWSHWSTNEVFQVGMLLFLGASVTFLLILYV